MFFIIQILNKTYMSSTLAQLAGINTANRKITNTSGRKYMVTKLMDAGIAEMENIHVTGHKDIRSFKNRVSKIVCF